MIPSLFLIIVGTVVSGAMAYQGADVKRFTDRFRKDAPPTSFFSVALMNERFASELSVAQRATHAQPLAAARHLVDSTSAPAMKAARERAATDPKVYDQAVVDLGRGLAQLPSMRSAVDSGRATLLQVDSFYSTMIASVSKSLFLIAKSEPVPEAAVRFTNAVALFQSTDVWMNADGFALAAAIGPGLDDAEYRRYAELLGGARTILDQTIPLLDDADAKQYAAMRSGPAWTRLAAAQDAILRRGAVGQPAASARGDAAQGGDPARGDAAQGGAARGTAGEAGATARRPAQRAATPDAAGLPDERTWMADTLQVLGAFGSTGTKLSQDAAALSGRTGQEQLTRSLLLGAGLLLLAVVVGVVTTLASRRLIRRLQDLRRRTLELAHEQLPDIVRRLRDGEAVDIGSELRPLRFGNDEIGEVAEAFEEAQRSAVVAAAREAETRAGLRTVFLDIARRSQSIVYRQLNVLDQAERTQEDPDQLGLLFQLDHLATRSRRNAENLIILGGGQPGRQWRNPVSLLEIVRSAISESEDYVRVGVAQVPRVEIAGSVVADLIHLIAELVDNATSFSPPLSRVEVRGNLVGRGLVLEVEDQGLGIDAEQLDDLNRMLHQPPDFQVMALADEPRLGLFVVAQLASRHGIRVTLTQSPAYGGTRVVVLLPTTVIAGGAEGAADAPPAAVPAFAGAPLGPDTGQQALEQRAVEHRVPRHGRPPLVAVPGPAPAQVSASTSPSVSAPASVSASPSVPVPGPAPSPGQPAAPAPLPTRPVPPAPSEAAFAQAAPFPPEPVPAPATGGIGIPEPDPAADGGFSTGRLFEAPYRPAPTFEPADRVIVLPPDPPRPPDVPVAPPRPATTDRTPAYAGAVPGAAEPRRDEAGAGRPVLPRRNPQSHLSPRLRDEPRPVDQQTRPHDDLPDPEQARSRMSALQRGTMRGRATDPENPR